MAILYVVATPIGNLQYLSPRGTETLRNADLIIAATDTAKKAKPPAWPGRSWRRT